MQQSIKRRQSHLTFSCARLRDGGFVTPEFSLETLVMFVALIFLMAILLLLAISPQWVLIFLLVCFSILAWFAARMGRTH